MYRIDLVTPRMFYYRDLMKKHMKKKELEALLEHNKQEIPVGEVIEENMPSCKLLVFNTITQN